MKAKRSEKKSGMIGSVLSLLVTEFSYYKVHLILMFAFIIILSVMYLQSPPTLSIFPVLYIPFLIHSQLFVAWSKEKRIRSHVLLPVSIIQIALLRILLIMIPYFFIYIIFMIIYNLLEPGWHTHHGQMIYILSVVFIFYFIYFIFQDKMPPNKKGFFKILAGIIIVLIYLCIVISIIIFYSDTQEPPANTVS